jgi:secondary thiamine-phosphate synthase enzyme
MAWHQTIVRLAPRRRGFHLVTDELLGQLPQLRTVRVGMAQFFLQHTSASLTINENADPDVRADMERWCDQAAPDGARYLVHDAEGPDDMPAHIKSSLFGCSLSIPIAAGRLALGTWQGIWLGEHRDHGGARNVMVTLVGDP